MKTFFTSAVFFIIFSATQVLAQVRLHSDSMHFYTPCFRPVTIRLNAISGSRTDLYGSETFMMSGEAMGQEPEQINFGPAFMGYYIDGHKVPFDSMAFYMSCRGRGVTAIFIDGVRVFNSVPGGVCNMKSCHNNDTAWFSDRDTEHKYVLYADQVKIGIRKPEDFTLFFTRPVRHNETAVYIDGVRLIQP